MLDKPAALQGFRLGKYDLVVESDGKGGFQYLYDPARPESVLSRAEVDDALQVSAGRKNPLPTSSVISNEPGSRYIDFLIPGLIGMNLMNSGMWSVGFALVDMRQRKLLKRFVATPMRRSDFLLALASGRLVLMITEVGLAARVWRAGLSYPRARVVVVDPATERDWRGGIRRTGPAHGQPCAEN